jgi:hypothetical protein
VVDKVALRQVFCEYFGFSSRAGTIDQLVPSYQVDSVSRKKEGAEILRGIKK